MPALTPANDLVRARNVTASECYALLGKHPYSTPQKIYDRLTAPYVGPPQQSEAMRIGSYLEPYVARYAARSLGLKVRAATKSVEHPTSHLCATPDYIVLGQRMLMEVKVSSILYGWSEEDLHPHYEYQARAQMACTNRDVCIVVALVGSALKVAPVTRDYEKEVKLLHAVDEFWMNHVLLGIRPSDALPTPLTAVVEKGK